MRNPLPIAQLVFVDHHSREVARVVARQSNTPNAPGKWTVLRQKKVGKKWTDDKMYARKYGTSIRNAVDLCVEWWRKLHSPGTDPTIAAARGVARGKK